MRPRTACTWAVAAMMVLVIPASGRADTAAQVAKRLREKLLSQWECDNLQISVVPYADQNVTSRGRFKTISVRADRAVRKGIAMRPMYVKGADVTLDLEKLFGEEFSVETKSRGRTEMHIELAEEDLTEGLRQAQDAVPDIAASLRGGLVTLTGTYKLLVGNKFKMAGKLQCEGGYKINFIPTAAKVNGIPIPISGLKVLLAKLNPILDLSTVIMRPKITTMEVKDGKLVAKS